MIQTELLRKNDRRRFTRIPVRQLRSSVLSPWVGFTDVWVVDLSLGGAFLRTPTPLPVGETMALELPRTHGGPLRLPTRVVSSRGAGRPGIGVSFDELDPMSLVELRDLLRTLAPPGLALEVARPQEADRTVVGPIPSAPPPLPRPSGLQVAAPRPSMPAVPPVALGALPPSPSATRQLEGQVKALQLQLIDLQGHLDSRTREAEALRETVTRLQASNSALRRGIVGG